MTNPLRLILERTKNEKEHISPTPRLNPNGLNQDSLSEGYIREHISNTLGILSLMSEDILSQKQTEYLASLKSSCDTLVRDLQITLEACSSISENKIIQKNQFANQENEQSSQRKILLICNQPIQKTILGNLLKKWGYKIQILNELPEEISLLSVLKNELIILSKSGNNFTSYCLDELEDNNFPFLVLSNSMAPAGISPKHYPVIQGPIEPDFLKYKIERILNPYHIEKE